MLMGFIYVYSKEFSLVLAKWKYAMDFPGGPVVKTSYAGGMGLTPCWGTKIPNAGCSQKNKNKMQICYHSFDECDNWSCLLGRLNFLAKAHELLSGITATDKNKSLQVFCRYFIIWEYAPYSAFTVFLKRFHVVYSWQVNNSLNLIILRFHFIFIF